LLVERLAQGKASAKSWNSPVKIRVAHTLRVEVAHPSGVVGASREDVGPAKRNNSGWWKKKKETEGMEGMMQSCVHVLVLHMRAGAALLAARGGGGTDEGGRKGHLTVTPISKAEENQPHPNFAGDLSGQEPPQTAQDEEAGSQQEGACFELLWSNLRRARLPLCCGDRSEGGLGC